MQIFWQNYLSVLPFPIKNASKLKLPQTFFFQRLEKQTAFILSACPTAPLQPTGNQVREGHILMSFFYSHLMICSSQFSVLVLGNIRNVLIHKLWLQS